MNNIELARQLVERLAAAITTGVLNPNDTAAGGGAAARVWSAIDGRLASDRLSSATLLLFANDPGSRDLQRRLAQALAARCPADELQGHLAMLQGGGTVKSRILADEDALIQGSGHKVLLPPGPVDLETRAGKGGRIIDSPITIVGAGTPAYTPLRPTMPAQNREPLPATLSTDGIHFSYGHALVIGVGAYDHPYIPTVPTTANDARALAALLRDPQLAAYPDSQVRVLVDAKATRANILDALEELAQRVAGTEQSTALIFFAGHGEPVGNTYALLPHDAALNKLGDTGITAELFHERIAKIRAAAKRLVVLLNCCHAGGLADETLGSTTSALLGAAPPPKFYRPLAVGSGQAVISSSRPEQKSAARSRQQPQHSPFGAHLLDALRGKAPGSGAAVGIFDLFAHLRAQVPLDARHTPLNSAPTLQEPLFYASQLDDNIPVALRPEGAGETLDVSAGLISRLVELELVIETLGERAPAEVLAERDGLLRRLEG
jgi:hypothetical protein